MVDRSFLFIKFRSICTLSGAQTFWDTLYIAFLPRLYFEDRLHHRVHFDHLLDAHSDLELHRLDEIELSTRVLGDYRP